MTTTPNVSHSRGPVASTAHEQTPIPDDVLLDVARSLFAEYLKIFDRQTAEIAWLRRQLVIAGALLRPAGAVLQ
jgi:hypothetical protein